jgi:hypothetical protein
MRNISRKAVKEWLESISGHLHSEAPHALEQAKMLLEMAREDLSRGIMPIRNRDTPQIAVSPDATFYETVHDFVCQALAAVRANKLTEARFRIDAALRWVREQAESCP